MNQLILLLVLLELYWSLDQSADRNHSRSRETFHFSLLQRTPSKVFPSRKGVLCDSFPPPFSCCDAFGALSHVGFSQQFCCSQHPAPGHHKDSQVAGVTLSPS